MRKKNSNFDEHTDFFVFKSVDTKIKRGNSEK